MTAGASAVLVMIGGGTAAIAALTDDETRVMTAAGADRPAGPAPHGRVPHARAPQPPAADARLGGGDGPVGQAAGRKPIGERADRRTSDQADRTATRAPRQTALDAGVAPALPVAAGQRPAVITRTVTETRAIPYRTRLIRDPRLPRGRKRVQTEGIPGEQTLRWLVTYSDGRPTDRRLLDSIVTRQPQHRVVAFGTRRGRDDDGPRECRPGSDHCFPIGRSAACPAEAGPALSGPAPSGPAESGSAQSGPAQARPAEAGDPARTESDRLPLDLLDHDFYLLTPEDLGGLELDPGLLC